MPAALDPAAIDTVRRELWPDLRDEHELHDLLLSLVALPLAVLDGDEARDWPVFYERLTRAGRVRRIEDVPGGHAGSPPSAFRTPPRSGPEQRNRRRLQKKTRS